MLSLLLLAQTVLCQFTLHEWVHNDEMPLSTYLLSQFVPPVESPVPPHALSRFSLRSALERWWAPEVVAPQRRLPPTQLSVLSDEDLAFLEQRPYKLGQACFWSLGGTPRDLPRAVALFEAAAAQGDVDAMFMLGVSYSTGLLGAVAEDQARAQLYYTLAADGGSLEAQIALVQRLQHGHHTPADQDAALFYARQAGLALLDDLQAFNAEESDRALLYDPESELRLDADVLANHAVWYYARLNQQVYSFGAERGTGLYGRNAYRKHLPPAPSSEVWMGDVSSATNFLNMMYPDEFVDLADAEKALSYRAEFDDDPKAMFALALVRYAQNDVQSSMQWASVCVEQKLLARNIFDVAGLEPIHSWCFEFIAERVLQVEALTPRTLSRVAQYYWIAARYPCKSCSSGMALVEWRAALELLKQMHERGAGSDQLDAILHELYGSSRSGGRSGGRNADADADADADASSSSSSAKTQSNLPQRVRNLVAVDALGHCNLNRTALVERFQWAFNTTYFFTDYTLGMKLAEFYIEDNELNRAVYVLRRVVSDAHIYAPAASLLLAKIQPNTPDMLQRFQEGIHMLQELYSPATFAQRSYEEGDVESAVLGFLVGSELGVRSSTLNLADLLDTTHSFIGKHLGPKHTKLAKALSQWALPSFVTGNRTALALRYFMRATQDGSADSLYKAIEIEPELAARYLPILQRHDLGMAHFTQGLRDFAQQKYERAMAMFSRAMISPEAWVPVKFWQFFTALRLLPHYSGEIESANGDGSGSSSSSSRFNVMRYWRKLKHAYDSIVAVDGYEDIDYKDFRGALAFYDRAGKAGGSGGGSGSGSGRRANEKVPPHKAPPAKSDSLFSRIVRALGLILIVKLTVHVAFDMLFPRGLPERVMAPWRRATESVRRALRLNMRNTAQDGAARDPVPIDTNLDTMNAPPPATANSEDWEDTDDSSSEN